MSRKFSVLPLVFSMAFCFAALAGPGSNPGLMAPREEPKPGAAPEAPGKNEGDPARVGDSTGKNTQDAGACNAAFESTQSSCNSYLRTSTGTPGQTPPSGSNPQLLNRIDSEMESAVAVSRKGAMACTNAAAACKNSCGTQLEVLDKCKGLREAALKKHAGIRQMANNNRRDNDNLRDQIVGRGNEEAPGGTNTPRSPGSSAPGPTSTPSQSNPAAAMTNPIKAQASAPVAATTPEQAKQERREQKREERRQEKIDAFNKAFMNLNPQQPLNQALQERPTNAADQRIVNAAGKAAAAAGSTANENKAEVKEEEEEIGRAGFNAMAMKNLAARKKLAAAMGVNAVNLPGASAIRPVAGSGSSGGPQFAGSGGFQYSGTGATLDPVNATERPSDLPQNFRLESPGAGGGGGGGSGSRPNLNARQSGGPTPTKMLSMNQSGEPSVRGPAGLEGAGLPHEIRQRNADIWNVISVSFRRHCALGRLMDCADHLPK